MRILDRVFKRSRAASGGEVGLVVGLVAIIIIGTVSLMGNRVDQLFLGAGNSVEEVIGFEDFSFTNVTHAQLSTEITSEIITIGTVPADTQAVIKAAPEGTHFILNGNDIGTQATINKGDQLALVTQSAAAPETTVAVTVRAGERYQTIWNVTTGSTTPNNLAFEEVLLAQPDSEIISPLYLPEGITVDSPIQIQGDETAQYRVDGGSWTNEDGILQVGQSVELKLLSGANDGTRKEVSVSIGEGTAIWAVTTIDEIVAGLNVPEQLDQIPDSYVETGEIYPADFDQEIDLSVAAPDGIEVAISLNGGVWEQGPVALAPDDFFKVRVKTPTTDETATDLTISLGETDVIWSVVTGKTTPISFTLTALDIVGAEAHTLVTTTKSFRPSGLTAQTQISTNGAYGTEYSIDYGEWTSNSSVLLPNSSVRLRMTTEEADGTTLAATLTIGGVSADWHVTTADKTPNAFAFEQEAGADISSFVSSKPVAITGIDAPTLAVIDDGEVSVDNGATFASSVEVPVGGSLIARTLSANTLLTEKRATVTVGTVSAEFSVLTRGNDSEPDQASVTVPNKENVEPQTEIISAVVTPEGIDAPMPISITSGTALISVAGGPWVTSAVVNPNKSFVFKTNSAAYGGAVTIGYDAGGIVKNWLVSTRVADATPDAFSFANLAEQDGNKVISSNKVTPSGFYDPATVSVTGGEVKIGGGNWTTSGSLQKGESLQLRVTSGIPNGVTSTVSLTVGGYSTNWTVKTVDTIMDDLWTQAELDGTVINRDFNCCQCVDFRVVTGITSPARFNSATKVNGHDYSPMIWSNGAYRGVGYMVQPGEQLRICASLNSGKTPGLVGYTDFDIGGKVFRLTTSTASDKGAIPYYSINMEDVAGATPSTFYQVTGELRGNKIPSKVKVGGTAQIRLPGSAGWTAAGSNIIVPVNGRFEVRMQSSSAANTAVSSVVEVENGAKRDTWTITTAAEDKFPNAVSDYSKTDTIIGGSYVLRNVNFSGNNACFNLTVEGEYSYFYVYSTNGHSSSGVKQHLVCPGQFIRSDIRTPTTPGETRTGIYKIEGVEWFRDSYTLDGSIDGTPDAFNFADVTGATAGSEIVSAQVNINSSKVPMDFTVTGEGSALAQVNGGGWVRSGTVSAGQKIRLKMTAGGPAGETRQATLTIAGVSATWNVTSADTTPAGFNFTNLADIEPASILGSNLVTISGINKAVPVTVTGDASAGVSIRGGGTVKSGTASVGDTLQIWMTSGSHGQSKTATLQVGASSSSWTVTTRAEDATPDSFNFTNLSGQDGNKLVTSPAVRIGGFLDEPLSISVAGAGNPQISVNGGSWVKTADLYANQPVAVRLTSGAEDGNTRTATVTVGGVSGDFSVTTKDLVPNNLSFADNNAAVAGTVVSSNNVTISGITAPITASVSGQGSPALEVNNSGSLVSSAIVSNGDVVKIHLTAPNTLGSTYQATLAANSVTAVWSVTTTVGN